MISCYPVKSEIDKQGVAMCAGNKKNLYLRDKQAAQQMLAAGQEKRPIMGWGCPVAG